LVECELVLPLRGCRGGLAFLEKTLRHGDMSKKGWGIERDRVLPAARVDLGRSVRCGLGQEEEK
jgi:hypothetical protein